MASVSTSVWQKPALIALTTQFRFSLFVPEIFPAAKSVHGPFKRNCLGLQKTSVSPSHNPCWCPQPEVNVFRLEPCAVLESLVWSQDPFPCSSGRTATAKTFLLIFNHRLWLWNQTILHLCPSRLSVTCLVLVKGLLFSHISGISE